MHARKHATTGQVQEHGENLKLRLLQSFKTAQCGDVACCLNVTRERIVLVIVVHERTSVHHNMDDPMGKFYKIRA